MDFLLLYINLTTYIQLHLYVWVLTLNTGTITYGQLSFALSSGSLRTPSPSRESLALDPYDPLFFEHDMSGGSYGLAKSPSLDLKG